MPTSEIKTRERVFVFIVVVLFPKCAITFIQHLMQVLNPKSSSTIPKYEKASHSLSFRWRISYFIFIAFGKSRGDSVRSFFRRRGFCVLPFCYFVPSRIRVGAAGKPRSVKREFAERESLVVRIEFQTEDTAEKQRNALCAKRYQTRRRVGKMELRDYRCNKNVNARYTISRGRGVSFFFSLPFYSRLISTFAAQFDNKVPFRAPT